MPNTVELALGITFETWGYQAQGGSSKQSIRRERGDGCKAAGAEVEHHCSEELGDRLTLLLKDLIALAAALPVVPHKVPALSTPCSVAAHPSHLFALSESVGVTLVLHTGIAMHGEPSDWPGAALAHKRQLGITEPAGWPALLQAPVRPGHPLGCTQI